MRKRRREKKRLSVVTKGDKRTSKHFTKDDDD